jgi:hypothetical protein
VLFYVVLRCDVYCSAMLFSVVLHYCDVFYVFSCVMLCCAVFCCVLCFVVLLNVVMFFTLFELGFVVLYSDLLCCVIMF